ncbi:cysteine dioxygenase family protein [Pararobbsia silviterrae]|nr:cysteine dioxygenase family protein [Pararobbsia silviterrae]
MFDDLSTHFRRVLEGACGAHADTFEARVCDALREAAPLVDLLPANVLDGCAERYARHLLASDASGRFAAAALIWRPGQVTPVHGHHTWCGYRVVKGALTEEWFSARGTDGRASYIGTRMRPAGAASFVGPASDGIHRLANRGTTVAVSIHVYGVHADALASRVNRLVDLDDPVLSATAAEAE